MEGIRGERGLLGLRWGAGGGGQVHWILGEGVLQQEERAAPEGSGAQIWGAGGSARPRTGEGWRGGEHH